MGKTAIVTGASRGIGRAIALKLAKDGFNVMINYAGNEALALEVKAACEQFGVQAEVCQANMGRQAEIEALVKATVDTFGRVDVLVNNAGITKDNLMLRMADADFDDVIDVNLKGVFYLTKAVSKLMFKKRQGKIINITSVSGVTGNVGQANYAASKAGVIGLTKTVAKELAPRGINVNAVAPGFIQTDMTDVLGEDLKVKITENVPLKRLGTPDDIANMVGFLVSEAANYVTGQVFHVDGGLVM
ncbi:MAG: 3-oxoacyl-[acyl-carrier-protein] reductase [Defluviitaleaceae bacterium]|nr:3-oxoacyl-[acyl-carrier-protein] reductase [Defluviitaleaceae bacterium]